MAQASRAALRELLNEKRLVQRAPGEVRCQRRAAPQGRQRVARMLRSCSRQQASEQPLPAPAVSKPPRYCRRGGWS